MEEGNTMPLLHYKWFNSYQVPIDVQIGVSRLELPLDLKVTNPNDVPQYVYMSAKIVSNNVSVYEAALGTHYAVLDEVRTCVCVCI